MELVQSLMGEPATSITALTEHFDRGPREVHDDLSLLKEYGIVYFFEGEGRARRPVVPYNHVTIEVELSVTA